MVASYSLIRLSILASLPFHNEYGGDRIFIPLDCREFASNCTIALIVSIILQPNMLFALDLKLKLYFINGDA
jgi:hypothetical protein